MADHTISGDCAICGIYRYSLHRDHIVPRWKFKYGLVEGDPTDPANFQYLCANCHEDKTREEFLSDEYRRIAVARVGLYTDEYRERQRQDRLGKQHTSEARAKIGAYARNRPPEVREKLRQGALKQHRGGIV